MYTARTVVQNNPFLYLKDVYILIPGAFEYVALLSKRTFADEIQFKGLHLGRLFCLIWWTLSNHMSP